MSGILPFSFVTNRPVSAVTTPAVTAATAANTVDTYTANTTTTTDTNDNQEKKSPSPFQVFEWAKTKNEVDYKRFRQLLQQKNPSLVIHSLIHLIQKTTNPNHIVYQNSNPIYTYQALQWVIQHDFVVHFWGKKEESYVLIFGTHYCCDNV